MSDIVKIPSMGVPYAPSNRNILCDGTIVFNEDVYLSIRCAV